MLILEILTLLLLLFYSFTLLNFYSYSFTLLLLFLLFYSYSYSFTLTLLLLFLLFLLLLFYSFTPLLFYSFALLLFYSLVYSFSIEHMTLPLLAPRSNDCANGALDTNVLQINTVYAMIVGKLLFVIQIESEICSLSVVSTTLFQLS